MIESIKKLRKNLKLTQEEIAKRLDISNSYISAIERGNVEGSKNIKKRILKYLEKKQLKDRDFSRVHNFNRKEFVNILYERKISYTGLAKRINCHPQTVFNWANDKCKPTLRHYKKIISALDLEKKDLIYGLDRIANTPKERNLIKEINKLKESY